jgi:hypothetical protein
MKPIRALWRIDIEPMTFNPKSGLLPWTGFVAMADLVQQLRSRLADRSGAAAWFLRLDPDIERCYRRRVSYSDHADTGWTAHCLDTATPRLSGASESGRVDRVRESLSPMQS